MRLYLIMFLLSGTVLSHAQTQQFLTSEGNLSLTPILHATMMLEWDGKTIYVDPYGGAESFAGMADPDLILITDIHGDHMNKETLAALNLGGAALVAPADVVDELGDMPFASTKALANGQRLRWEGMAIEAIPMYNLPETDDSRHPKGRGNGYVITFGDTRLYISGDTEDVPEMRALQDIDIALVCMNMPYTMTVDQAADAVLEFKPGVVIPFHFRGGGGQFADVEFFRRQVEEGDPDIEVRLLQWYPEN